MLPSHKKAMRAIESCRTAALGGHVYHCKKCEEDRYSYHSCKSRYCPRCGNEQADDWLAKQEQLLLNARYFLITFTLPAELRSLARSRQRCIYNILMRASAQTVLKVMRKRKYLGGMVGILSVLQTWTRDLRYHPHVHMVVAGGALSPDRQNWLSVAGPYLAPQNILGTVFAGKFYAALKKKDYRTPSHPVCGNNHGLSMFLLWVAAKRPCAIWRHTYSGSQSATAGLSNCKTAK